MLRVAPVALFPVLLVIGILVPNLLGLAVVLALVLYKLCFVALSSHSVTSTRFGKIQLRQNTVLEPSPNSFCCPWRAVKERLIEASRTATWVLLRTRIVRESGHGPVHGHRHRHPGTRVPG